MSGPNDQYTCPICGSTYGPYSNSRGAYKRHLKTKHKSDPRAQQILAGLGGGRRTRTKKQPSAPTIPKPPQVPDVFEIPEPEPKEEKEKPIAFRKRKEGDTYPIFKHRPPPIKIFRPERTSSYTRTIPSAIPIEQSPHATAKTFSDPNEPDAWRHYTSAELIKYGKQPIPNTGPIGLDYTGKQTGHTNLIWWNKISTEAPDAWPPDKQYREGFEDYSHIDTPHGILYELRNAFTRNRLNVCKGRKPINVLLQGPPGTGKTAAVKAFAAEAGLPYFYIPANPEIMGKEQLLGSITLKEGGVSAWRDGTIVKAGRYGGILHIDEFSLLDPEVQQVMHEMLDSNRRITLTSENGEVIRCHPDLFVVATMNPEEVGVAGVKTMSEPLRRRFTTFFMDYPPMVQELKIVKKSCKLDDGDLKIPQNPLVEEGTGKYGKDVVRFMRAVKEIREVAREEQSIRFVPTISEAIDFADCLLAGRSRNEALHISVVGKYIGQEREKVEESLRKQWNDYKADMRM